MTSRVLYALAFAGLLTLASLFLITALVSLGVAHFPVLGSSLAFASLVEVVVYLGLVAWLSRDFAAPKATLGFVRVPFELLLLGVGLGLALHGPADFVEAQVERWLPLPDAVMVERARRLSPSAALDRASLLFAAAAVIPLVEELFFRGALLGWLENASTRRAAAWLSGISFTLSHAEPRSWPALGLVAAALGLLRWASPGLLPCILLHATFNATTLAVLFVQPREALGRSEPSWPLFAVGSLLSFVMLQRAWRIRKAHLESTV